MSCSKRGESTAAGSSRSSSASCFPILRPAIGALAVWNFINSYNAFLWPLMIVSDPRRYTLALGLANLYGAQSRQIDLVMAGAVLAAVPTLDRVLRAPQAALGRSGGRRRQELKIT